MSLILRRIFTLEPVGATEPILAWTAQSGRGRQDGSSRGTGAGRSRGHGSVAGRSDAHRVGRGRQYPGGACCVFLLQDRKSVVEGKSVVVCVELGGREII